jgi:carboxymethylenebutenolidase
MTHLNCTIKSHDGKSFGAYYAKAAATPAPTLIIIQEIFGVNEGLIAMCDAWAAKGYNAVCPDLFWRQEAAVQLSDKAEAEWQKAFGFFKGFDVALGMEDLKSTLNFVRNMPECNGKVGSIGFCLGGKLAFLMAAQTNANCNISYYGVGLETLLHGVPTIT